MISRNKFVLPIIIILLLLTLPLGIYGLMLYKNDERIASNPNHEHKYNGKLYYYDGNNLLGTYTCISESCDDVTTTIRDEYLHLDYGSIDKIGGLNRLTALVNDENQIRLVALNVNTIIRVFSEVKNYKDWTY